MPIEYINIYIVETLKDLKFKYKIIEYGNVLGMHYTYVSTVYTVYLYMCILLKTKYSLKSDILVALTPKHNTNTK